MCGGATTDGPGEKQLVQQMAINAAPATLTSRDNCWIAQFTLELAPRDSDGVEKIVVASRSRRIYVSNLSDVNGNEGPRLLADCFVGVDVLRDQWSRLYTRR